MSYACRGIAVRTGTAAAIATIATIAIIAVVALGGTPARAEEAAEPLEGLTDEELAVEAPEPESDPSFEPADQPFDLAVKPIAAADADEVRIAPVPEIGYFDEQGRYVVDLMEQDYTYIAVRVETPDGQPVEDAEPTFAIEGTSQLFGPEDIAMQSMTNQYGIVEFAVLGGEMGLDRIAVEYGDATTEILINVISLRAAAYPTLTEGEGFMSWSDLMQAQVRFDDMTLFADFPEQVTERSGDTVKMTGFMMPLEAGMKQNWFILTTHPPGCFFHVPGGPSGAVEVFSEEGIRVSWDPIVLEGRFEALEKSDSAVYRLHDARIVNR